MAEKPYHHGNLRPVLLKAAVKMIEKHGADGWTLREVARRAGVSHAAPYRHFRNKEALLAAVAEAGFRELRAGIDAARAQAGGDSIARLEALGGVLLAFALQNPARYRVMLGPQISNRGRHPELAAAAEEVFSSLVSGVEECKHDQRIRDDLSPVLASITLWASIHGLGDLLLNRQLAAFDRDSKQALSLARAVGRVVYQGLQARKK